MSRQPGVPTAPIDRLLAARLLLHPASLAVIGATEDRTKFGGRLYAALVERGYAGRLYPINPRHAALLGRPAFPDLASLPETPDFAAIVLVAERALGAVQSCAKCFPVG